MKIIPYILYLFLIAFYATIVADIISILGVTVDLLIIIVVMIAFYKSETEALWFGMAAGVVAGATHLNLMPWEISIVSLIALAVNQIGGRINLESAVSKIFVLGCCALVHGIVMTLSVSTEEFFFVLIRYILPGAVYTLVIGSIFFLVKDGYISWSKIKALF
jgi:hypothetical protein